MKSLSASNIATASGLFLSALLAACAVPTSADSTTSAQSADSVGPTKLATEHGGVPSRLAADADAVYWLGLNIAADGRDWKVVVRKVKRTGGEVQSFELPESLQTGLDLTMDEGSLYVLTRQESDGTGQYPMLVHKLAKSFDTDVVIASHITGKIFGNSIANDATDVYWTESHDNQGEIWKASKSGGAAGLWLDGAIQTTAIAVDGAAVYWTDGGPVNLASGCEPGKGKVRKAFKTVIPVAFDLAVGESCPMGLQLDGGSAYWLAWGNEADRRTQVRRVSQFGGLATTFARISETHPVFAVGSGTIDFTTGAYPAALSIVEESTTLAVPKTVATSDPGFTFETITRNGSHAFYTQYEAGNDLGIYMK